MKYPNLLGKMKDIAKKFAKQSSAHGIPRLAHSQSVTGKIFWTCTCICALSMLITQGIILLNRYNSYPKSVRLDISNEAVPFPAVSICNIRSMDIHSLGEIVYNGSDMPRWKFGVDLNYTGKENSNFPAFESSVIQFVNLKQSYSAFAEILSRELNDSLFSWNAEKDMLSRMTVAANMNVTAAKEGGIQKAEFVAFCEYAGAYCSHHNFTQFLDPAYFNCFTFDTSLSNSHATIYEGPDYGLSLVLFVPTIGIMNYSGDAKGLLSVNQELTIGGEGVRVVIHRPNTIPFPLTDGINIPRGMAVYLGVQLTQQERLGPPHGNCTHRQKLGSFLNYTYTMTSCKKMCLQDLVTESCGCADPSLPIPGTENFTFCAAFDQLPEHCIGRNQVEANLESCRPILEKWFKRISCMRTTRNNISKNLSAWESCDCTPSCREDEYNFVYSLSDWPMEEQSRDLVKEILHGQSFLNNFPEDKAHRYFSSVHTPDNTRPSFEHYEKFVKDKNFLRLSVYVSDTSIFKIIETEGYSLTQLASDVGGQLSLWVGVSIITLVEMIEFIICLFHYCLDRKSDDDNKIRNGDDVSETPSPIKRVKTIQVVSTQKPKIDSFQDINQPIT